MKYLPRPLTAALVAAIALALTGGDLLAAKKDKGKDGGGDRKGKKEQVQRKSGGGDRGQRVAQSRRTASKPERRVVARSTPKPKASKPSSRDTKRLAVQRSKGSSDNARKRSDAIVRQRMVSASSRDRVADAKRKSIERSQNIAKTRDRIDRDRTRVVKRDTKPDVKRIVKRDTKPDVKRIVKRDSKPDVKRDRSDVRREIDRRSIATSARRDNDRDHDRDRDHRSHSHRDRSHYTVRHDHEHHSHDWYRSNGYAYDHDYYRTYRRHRYYNDALGMFLFALTAPPAYVYESNTYAYDSTPYYSGYGYETRVAVQEELALAGYYDGGIDGVVGPGTRSAIYNYQQDYGLEPTGRIDDQLLQSLGLTTY
jgi:hypothetical protein